MAVQVTYLIALCKQEQAERAVAWLTTLTPLDRLLKSGLFGAKFQWLST